MYANYLYFYINKHNAMINLQKNHTSAVSLLTLKRNKNKVSSSKSRTGINELRVSNSKSRTGVNALRVTIFSRATKIGAKMGVIEW